MHIYGIYMRCSKTISWCGLYTFLYKRYNIILKNMIYCCQKKRRKNSKINLQPFFLCFKVYTSVYLYIHMYIYAYIILYILNILKWFHFACMICACIRICYIWISLHINIDSVLNFFFFSHTFGYVYRGVFFCVFSVLIFFCILLCFFTITNISVSKACC